MFESVYYAEKYLFKVLVHVWPFSSQLALAKYVLKTAYCAVWAFATQDFYMFIKFNLLFYASILSLLTALLE